MAASTRLGVDAAEAAVILGYGTIVTDRGRPPILGGVAAPIGAVHYTADICFADRLPKGETHAPAL